MNTNTTTETTPKLLIPKQENIELPIPQQSSSSSEQQPEIPTSTQDTQAINPNSTSNSNPTQESQEIDTLPTPTNTTTQQHQTHQSTTTVPVPQAQSQAPVSTIPQPPAPAPAPPAPSTSQAQSDIIMQKLWSELQQLIDSQASVMKNPTQDSYILVSSVQKALQEKTSQILREISTLWCKSLLQPQDIGKVRDAVQDLAVIQRQLEVLRSELDTLPFAASTSAAASTAQPSTTTTTSSSSSSSGGGPTTAATIPPQPSASGSGSSSGNAKVSAALVVKRQPFPLVLRKGEQLGEQDSIIVRLVPLSLSAEVMTITSQVRVQVVCDSHQTSRSLATHELIQPLAINIDPTTLVARFTLHFLDGTKNTPVSLRFSLQILVQNSVPLTLESELTAPFIVITHKDQWRGAAGTMLKRDAFLHQYEIPWPQLANTLQTHFLRATKQAQATGTHRPLSEFDLVYLNKKFFGGKPVVDQSQFDTFWQWYGAALDTIRHQRPILGLWWQGLVYGFASKDDVNVALAREAPGTFLIRFSESFPGSFAIAYTTGEGVKHYLVTPQDHALHKTLPDFVVAQPQFVNVLQLQISQDPVTGKAKLQLVRVNKTAAFESFCTKKPPQPRPLPPGYSSL